MATEKPSNVVDGCGAEVAAELANQLHTLITAVRRGAFAFKDRAREDYVAEDKKEDAAFSAILKILYGGE